MKHTLLLILLSISCNILLSQINYNEIRQKKLEPGVIDTTSSDCISIHKRYATVYFSKADLKDYLIPYNTLGVRIDMNHEAIEAALDTSRSRLDFIDWWAGYTEEERSRHRSEPSLNSINRTILSDLYYPGADLIHDGKFMVVSHKTGEIVTRGLRIRRIKGMYETRYAEFQLPDGHPFWTIVTQLGE